MDAPGSNGPAQMTGMLKEVYAKPTKSTKKTSLKFNKIKQMLGCK